MPVRLALFLAAALALAAPSPAAAQSGATAQPPAKPARAAPRSAAQALIVCTKRACVPLPRGCHAETEFTWEGDPTGYQIIVCP
jgi:hypothetical protein